MLSTILAGAYTLIVWGVALGGLILIIKLREVASEVTRLFEYRRIAVIFALAAFLYALVPTRPAGYCTAAFIAVAAGYTFASARVADRLAVAAKQ